MSKKRKKKQRLEENQLQSSDEALLAHRELQFLRDTSKAQGRTRSREEHIERLQRSEERTKKLMRVQRRIQRKGKQDAH